MIDALERGVACVEAKYCCRWFVNSCVFADRKLIGDDGGSHLFLRNSRLQGFRRVRSSQRPCEINES
ncbi:MAG TPA: hypothetical protein VJ248_02950, partial [Candidatus Udaeobacter sp.]|nr:hypothetical protein [Candidatus Udaeobacter sp.]